MTNTGTSASTTTTSTFTPTSSKNNIPYKQERLARIIVQHRNGMTSVGTGFFIDNKGSLLTCFHVILGMELSKIGMKEQKEHEKLQAFLQSSLMNITIETGDEIEKKNVKRRQVSLIKFNEFYDVALLQVNKNMEEDARTVSGNSTTPSTSPTPFFEIDTEYESNYDESTFFCGYQMTGDNLPLDQYPFSVNRAVISAFPEVTVGGERYKHIQLNSINLNGNSGAPLFIEGSDKVIGMINGNMNWGGNNLVMVNRTVQDLQNTPPTPPTLSQGTLLVPLCIAYATPIKIIKEKTDIFG